MTPYLLVFGEDFIDRFPEGTEAYPVTFQAQSEESKPVDGWLVPRLDRELDVIVGEGDAEDASLAAGIQDRLMECL